MDKKQSRFVKGFSKLINNHKSDRSKLLKSIVSLVLALVIFATCTFCWYCLKTAEATADNFQLNAGKGLRVNDTGTSQFQSDENDFELLPASSVDGRNLFFPTDGTDFSDVTKEMTFRSANAGDKNVNYIQIDFKVTAQANHTSIYINPEKTWLKVYHDADKSASNYASLHQTALNGANAQQAAPLRMAICSSAPDKDGNPIPPVVFNSQAKTVNTAAVSEVDRGSGQYLSNGPQVAHQFSDYAVGGTPITTLDAGQETLFSVIIWLEGCDSKCTWNKINSINKNDIYLGLAFKTSWDNTDVIRFKDDTSNSWIKNKINEHYTLAVRYTDPDNSSDITDFQTYQYSGTDNEWTASVPSDMKNKITFVLSPPAGTNGDTYVFCRSTDDASASTENRGVNRQYVVTLGPASTTSLCRGKWTPLGDSDGGGVDIGDLDGDDF